MITEFYTVQNEPDYLIPEGFFAGQVNGFGELIDYHRIEIVRETENVPMSRYAIAHQNWVTNYPISTPWGGSTASGTKYLALGVGGDHFYVDNEYPY